MTFNEFFRVARQALGITQAKVGEVIGADWVRVARIETDQADPTANEFYRLREFAVRSGPFTAIAQAVVQVQAKPLERRIG